MRGYAKPDPILRPPRATAHMIILAWQVLGFPLAYKAKCADELQWIGVCIAVGRDQVTVTVPADKIKDTTWFIIVDTNIHTY